MSDPGSGGNDEFRMANDELPEGWMNAAFGSVTTLKTGPFGSSLGKKDYTQGGVPLVNPMHIQNGKIMPKDSALVSPQTIERLSEFCLITGDVVLGRRGEMGRCAVVGEAQSGWLCGTGSLIVRPTLSLHPEYLQRFLSSPSVVAELIGASVGSTMVNLNQRILAGLRIPMPPFAEQKRIADKLEAVLGRVDACRARLDRVPALLKRFRQSVLAAATSGKLTEEWRMTNGVNDEWEEVRVQDVAAQVFDGPFGSHLKTADYTSTGVRVSRLENIGWMIFHADKEAFISPAKYKTLTRHTLKRDDVVFSSFISEETRVALLPESWSGKAINKSDCYCVRVDQKNCLPKYLMLRLACRSTYHVLGEDIHGATRPRINLGQLKNFTFSLPTLLEQQEIVRRVEDLFAFADRIEARLATARKTVERLTPATLAKAFRGELVPRDPADEPAAALLERLRQAGGAEAAAKPKRGRRSARA